MILTSTILLVLMTGLCGSQDQSDTYLTGPQIIRKYGYTCEIHNIETEDGYIIETHRIPHGRNGETNSKRGPIILQHGLLGSSVDWIISGVDKAFGYALADVGYDVWMPNSRGNKYSRKHKTLNPDKDASFWNFSWHELGIYDLPAVIDYILNTTNRENLFYVGHSQGTTAFYVMASEKPEYNSKIRAHFSLAPIAYMNHMVSPFYRIISRFELFFTPLSKVIGVNEFIPGDDILNLLAPIICGDEILAKLICSNVYFIQYGFNRKEMNITLLPIILGHMPAGASSKQVSHYAQEINSRQFRQFDYRLRNLNKYGSLTPPQYKVEKITAPIYLFVSHGDWLSSLIDVDRLVKRLPNVAGKFVNEDKQWSHIDYVFGINAKTRIYEPIIKIMNDY